MSAEIIDLCTLLDLERIEQNIFRGHSPQIGWQRVYGGLVIAQALVACARTIEDRPEDRPPHSLHAYFILPGDPSVPIVYEVERLRDGKSFATRRCNAIQHGAVIFTLSASFQAEEEGLYHALPMPDVPRPERLPSEAELIARFGDQLPEAALRWFERHKQIEIRPVEFARYLEDAPPAPRQHVWLRATQRLPEDPAIHRAALAYLSDMTLLDTALAAHGRSLFQPALQVASLDHAIWFHRRPRADAWLLYVQDCPNTRGSRGLTRGLLYGEDGRLVASVAQEGLMRLRTR